MSSLAAGGSLPWFTVIVTVASVAVGGAVVRSVGEGVRAGRAGVWRVAMEPLAFRVSVPWAGSETLTAVSGRCWI